MGLSPELTIPKPKLFAPITRTDVKPENVWKCHTTSSDALTPAGHTYTPGTSHVLVPARSHITSRFLPKSRGSGLNVCGEDILGSVQTSVSGTYCPDGKRPTVKSVQAHATRCSQSAVLQLLSAPLWRMANSKLVSGRSVLCRDHAAAPAVTISTAAAGPPWSYSLSSAPLALIDGRPRRSKGSPNGVTGVNKQSEDCVETSSEPELRQKQAGLQVYP